MCAGVVLSAGNGFGGLRPPTGGKCQMRQQRTTSSHRNTYATGNRHITCQLPCGLLLARVPPAVGWIIPLPHNQRFCALLDMGTIGHYQPAILHANDMCLCVCVCLFVWLRVRVWHANVVFDMWQTFFAFALADKLWLHATKRYVFVCVAKLLLLS